MKKLFAIVLVFLFSFCLISCGNKTTVSSIEVVVSKDYGKVIEFAKTEWLNHKFCGISDSSRSSVGSYRIASERNIRHQDIRIPVCEES